MGEAREVPMRLVRQGAWWEDRIAELRDRGTPVSDVEIMGLLNERPVQSMRAVFVDGKIDHRLWIDELGNEWRIDG